MATNKQVCLAYFCLLNLIFVTGYPNLRFLCFKIQRFFLSFIRKEKLRLLSYAFLVISSHYSLENEQFTQPLRALQN